MAALSLAACAEEGPGPQFASDPRPSQLPTEAAAIASPQPLPTTQKAATPGSVRDLLATRGAISNIFIESGNVVWLVAGDGEATPLFEAPVGSEIQAIDPSPSAQQVAVLIRNVSAARQTSEVVIIDAVGETTARLGDLGAFPATPTSGLGDTAEAIDWSPQGDRALVSFQSGTIVDLPVAGNGDPTILDVLGEGESVIAPAWSPTGESIAFVFATNGGRSRSLRVLDTNDGRVSEVVIPAAGRLVVDYAWMPNGISLLFTEGGEPGSAATGIDLWSVDADGDNRELVASAGTVAPVARITNVRPSPDGRSVAYSVLVPGPDGPQVDSVWVRDLASRLGFRIPLPSVAAVDDVWWTENGLVVSVRTSGTRQGRRESQALLQIKRDGSISALWAAPVIAGTPVSGTPVASPAAT